MHSQEKLISSLKCLDKVALNYFYDKYASSLYGLIYKQLNDKSYCDQVFEKVFVTIVMSIDKFDPVKSSLFIWMFTIARNEALNKKNAAKQDLLN